MVGKKEIVTEVANRTGYAMKYVAEMLDGLEEVVYDHLATDEVRIINGIILYPVHREARIARNPKTGEQVSIAAKNVPKCRFGKRAKEAVNGITRQELVPEVIEIEEPDEMDLVFGGN